MSFLQGCADSSVLINFLKLQRTELLAGLLDGDDSEVALRARRRTETSTLGREVGGDLSPDIGGHRKAYS